LSIVRDREQWDGSSPRLPYLKRRHVPGKPPWSEFRTSDLRTSVRVSSARMGDRLRHPVCDKDIGLVGRRSPPVGGPDELLAVRAEVRESIELPPERYPLDGAGLERDSVYVEL